MTVVLRSLTCWALPALALAASFGGAAGLAQTQDRSFWSRPSTPVENQRFGPRQDSRPDQRADDAARLYADARSDLEAGQYGAAQRKLEVLVAQYPANPLVDVARRDLQRLYAGTLGPSQPAAPPVPAARAIQQPDPPTKMAPVGLQPTQMPQPTPLRDASEDFRHLAGDRIFFADSSADLGGRAKSALEAQAAWLIRYPGVEIVIEGHSDDHGSREFNRTLAEKRANAVKLRLNDLGVAADRIAIAAFGRDRPVADCPEAHCSAQNRRVVTNIARIPAGLTFDITRGPQNGTPDRSASVPMR